ncbi:MAG: hypothetical protein LUF30_12375, partial [Lachnospiraceae bacterium]|nr:hypothetical protein [Lachnospiraceae bacterium]
MEKYLLDCLNDYTSSDAYPLHMPGHKRQISHFSDPFAIDITEIEGFDNLHHAEGILLEAQKRASKLYGADETWYLVNGSTCGILAAVSASVRRGGRILMARNCHKAAYHAAFLNGLQVTWLYPEIDMGTGICGSISPGQVREALEALRQGDAPDTSQPLAVLLTSPTYVGVVSDIRAIAQEVHRAGGILIVDEAHGAHFAMHPYFPESALSCGADIVINSLHKTMPSLTQTALLHVKGSRADRERLRKYLDIYQSSSPSYVLMAGMDECVRMMETQGRKLFDAFVVRLETLREHLKKMQVLRLVTGDESELQAFAYDASKIIIAVPDITGPDITVPPLTAERFAEMPPCCARRQVDPLMEVRCAKSGSSNMAGGLAGAADAAHADTPVPLPTAERFLKAAGDLADVSEDASSDRVSTVFSGPMLGRILRERYHLEPEMEAEHYVTAIMTVADTQEGFDRLERALLEIDEWLADLLTPRNQKVRVILGEAWS